jgi:hypothetical protein
MNTIIQKLTYQVGTEGPKHDPYHFDEWTFIQKKEYGPEWKLVLRIGLAVRLEVKKNGKSIHVINQLEGNAACTFWLDVTHLKIQRLESYHERIHGPYIEEGIYGGK